tara:strand:+ start:550 stop:1620 length:1071 start_codon:yes stop_codon:yes gene_type:complete
MLSKLENKYNRFLELSELISDPAIISDMNKFVPLSKEYKELEKIVDCYKKYKNLIENIESGKEMLSSEKDEEMKSFAKEEIERSEKDKIDLEKEIRILLIPKDPNDSKNVIFEIRAGTGGDEACIFAGDLYRMYVNFCDSKKWSVELVDFNQGTSGGYKEIIFNVSGENVYGFLKFESGVHRVQRVPKTETQGRVHTSAATVVVLPEAEDFDIELNDSDIKKETYCSSGPGGQSVNTTYSAVRLTHLPTGVVAQCQDQKSQIKNYAKALKVLRSRIYEIELEKRNKDMSDKRKTMVKTGDRSDKIRTYNYPQGRVTDHRISLTLYNLNDIINGDVSKLIDELQIEENSQLLEGQND